MPDKNLSQGSSWVRVETEGLAGPAHRASFPDGWRAIVEALDES